LRRQPRSAYLSRIPRPDLDFPLPRQPRTTSEPVTVIADLRFDPEHRDAVLELARRHVRNTLAAEPDCLRFELVEPKDEPSSLVFCEVFASEAAFAAHRDSAHAAWFREARAPYVREGRVREFRPVPPASAGVVLCGAPTVANHRGYLAPLEEAGFEIRWNEFGRPLTEASRPQQPLAQQRDRARAVGQLVPARAVPESLHGLQPLEGLPQRLAQPPLPLAAGRAPDPRPGFARTRPPPTNHCSEKGRCSARLRVHARKHWMAQEARDACTRTLVLAGRRIGRGIIAAQKLSVLARSDGDTHPRPKDGLAGEEPQLRARGAILRGRFLGAAHLSAPARRATRRRVGAGPLRTRTSPSRPP
jgi:(4S)-4-hydroxy-5-phosphonooxypentane-2,3-dione isomerase